MTASDHAGLKRLAEGATPGIWYWENGRLRSPEEDGSGVDEYVLNPDYDYRRDDSQIDVSDEDAAFIAAANPAAVLELLSEIEGLNDLYDLTGRQCDGWKARALEAERQLAALRTQAPDSWRPDRDAVRKVVDWLADEIGAAERGKATTRKSRKVYAKDEAVNRIAAALRPQTAESGK